MPFAGVMVVIGVAMVIRLVVIDRAIARIEDELKQGVRVRFRSSCPHLYRQQRDGEQEDDRNG